MLTLKNLTKVFRTDDVETTALNGIDFHINHGEFITIMGPSGCGKSTLLNIIGLLDSPTSGSYRFLDKEMSNLNEKGRAEVRKQNIGYIFQNFNLIDEISVYENIELPLLYNNVPAAERRKRVGDMVERLGIPHRMKHYPQQLSGGQQQRVAVARALVNNPHLILADEPTGNLDSRSGNEVMEMLTDLHAKGATILMVTHSAYDASFSQKTIEVKDGIIVAEKNNHRNIDFLVNSK